MKKDERKSLFECGIDRITLEGAVYVPDRAEGVARGGSCLVYRAVKKDAKTASRDRKVILKEFYPLGGDGCGRRGEDGLLRVPDTDAGIREQKARFRDSFRIFTKVSLSSWKEKPVCLMRPSFRACLIKSW